MDFNKIVNLMVGQQVDRPNSSTSGTLSGHAAGEPFEKCVYHLLKREYPNLIFKQFEFLNDLYLKNPTHITVEDRNSLINCPTALFLLSRSDKATKAWSPNNIFEEKQNDTADILYREGNLYDIIDVKTRNISKNAQPPNIISAYKLAKTCAYMIDNDDYKNIGIDYIEIDWKEKGDKLECVNAYHGDLFKALPEELYINWTAAMQLQFHICNLDQSWNNTREEWARHFIKHFVESAETRCVKMRETYIEPFLKYI